MEEISLMYLPAFRDACKNAERFLLWLQISHMFIIANHTIHHPEDFWALAQKDLPNLPEAGVKRVLNIFPNQTLDKATCVWEADSIENLQRYLREKLGSASNETFFQINEAAAMGLSD